MILTDATSLTRNQSVLKIQTHSENWKIYQMEAAVHGHVQKCLEVSKSGIEGFSLKNGRH